MTNALALAKALIAAPSITPATGAVFDILEAALVPLGFAVDRFVAGGAPDGPVENLFATRSAGNGPHFVSVQAGAFRADAVQAVTVEKGVFTHDPRPALFAKQLGDQIEVPQ